MIYGLAPDQRKNVILEARQPGFMLAVLPPAPQRLVAVAGHLRERGSTFGSQARFFDGIKTAADHLPDIGRQRAGFGERDVVNRPQAVVLPPTRVTEAEDPIA